MPSTLIYNILSDKVCLLPICWLLTYSISTNELEFLLPQGVTAMNNYINHNLYSEWKVYISKIRTVPDNLIS